MESNVELEFLQSNRDSYIKNNIRNFTNDFSNQKYITDYYKKIIFDKTQTLNFYESDFKSLSDSLTSSLNSLTGFSHSLKLLSGKIKEQKNSKIMISRLIDLLQEPERDEDGERTRPTDYAFNHTHKLINSAISLLKGVDIQRGMVFTTSEGGIKVEWSIGDKELRLRVAEGGEGLTYLYKEVKGVPGLFRNPDALTLSRELNWLNAVG